MKRITAIAILIAGAAAGSATGASAQQTQVLAKVPFDFVVDNRTLPAGTYRIEPHGDSSLEIDSLDGNGGVYAIAFQGNTTSNGGADLYFDVVGGDHYLRRVASPAATTSMEFPECKMEKSNVLRASRDKTEVINAVASR